MLEGLKVSEHTLLRSLMSGQELAVLEPPQYEQLTLFNDSDLAALPAAGAAAHKRGDWP
ncbi:hypothetical protein D3C87_2114650 [compost metagenome]